ncbi:hypothetical protein HHI36_016713 [Cryptolaemus montrouzieri]|uniref:Uncharacterized protein n=1 Tax=Cryptolaemus montrouzieri TaxID=559131 RepID=A0ABD2NL95_9CUCU
MYDHECPLVAFTINVWSFLNVGLNILFFDAHGKRSGFGESPSKYGDSNRLLLARLIQQNMNERNEIENEREMKENEILPSRVEIQRLLNDVDIESNPLKG